MKILYVMNVGGFSSFFKYFTPFLKKENCIIDYAFNSNYSQLCDECKDENSTSYNINLSRNPFKLSNLKAIKEIRKIILDGNYDIVHFHTAVPSIFGRLACLKIRNKIKTKYVYTPHGLNFNKNSGLISWLFFYPIEKIFAKYVDCVIAMNKEEFNLMKKMNYPKIEFSHGVGIKLDVVVKNHDSLSIRKELGIKDDDLVFLSVGEL